MAFIETHTETDFSILKYLLLMQNVQLLQALIFDFVLILIVYFATMCSFCQEFSLRPLLKVTHLFVV